MTVVVSTAIQAGRPELRDRDEMHLSVQKARPTFASQCPDIVQRMGSRACLGDLLPEFAVALTALQIATATPRAHLRQSRASISCMLN